MEKFTQKVMECVEYYSNLYTISGNQNLSSSESSRTNSYKKEIEIMNIQHLVAPQHK